ncbi:hypothetical protein DERP_002076 [Dermatophagoides pteronyssinus]|uniref:Uncharacterized protein n=1 Tax=Dermatophagoides pteronyssinus TaxID=6956 RepID=A0ABQ8JH84_DERPT|nr:hypothetical protein DERP_002076 [Dermatophagoides pteronyssinus]
MNKLSIRHSFTSSDCISHNIYLNLFFYSQFTHKIITNGFLIRNPEDSLQILSRIKLIIYDDMIN